MAASPSPGAPPAVIVDSVSKAFALPTERAHTLKERALHPGRGRRRNPFDALRDISFEVRQGEFFGIVGRNGSGKSTLLKCLAGIYATDTGEIRVAGRLSTFIELGVGFNPDLAARDNIVMNAIMLGLSPAEARRRVDDVIAFAELEEFADLKLKNYSSGMHVRLAFSVLIQVDADVLLIDEVLAVGDASFQQKCFDVFHRLRDEGRTILFVTHDMGAVERFCHRAMLLERGELVMIGDPHEVGSRYLDVNFSRANEVLAATSERAGDGSARIVDLWIEDAAGNRATHISQGLRCTLKAHVRFRDDLVDPEFNFSWVNHLQQNQFTVSTLVEDGTTGSFSASEHALVSVAFDNVFAPGRYQVSSLIMRAGGGADIDLWERAISVVVTDGTPAGGLVDLPYEMSIEHPVRAAADEPARIQ